MIRVETSIQYIKNRYAWEIIEGTIQVLDETEALWVARMTTTHLAARGEKEEIFNVMVSFKSYIVLPGGSLPILENWCHKVSSIIG